MKKTLVITVMALFLVFPLLMAVPVMAAYNDFVADADITVSNVSGTGVTADMVIKDQTTVESWSITDGVFVVTLADNSLSMFAATFSDSTAISITYGSGTGECKINNFPGTSVLSITTAGTYTIQPSTSTCTETAASTGTGSSVPVSSGSSGDTTTTDTTTTDTTTTDTTTTTEAPAVGEPATDAQGDVTLGQMTADAETVVTGDVNQVIAKMGVSRDTSAEATFSDTIVANVIADTAVTAQVRNAFTNFVTYGTPATQALGAGERAGVVNSFKAALGKMPTTAQDWNDVVKIANGRWPSQTSQVAEDRAAISFKTVYLRTPDRTNPHDDAAITVMAYGLRPANRNMDSEKAAIKTFKAIYGYNPSAATAWDVVRAVAYSGSTR